jgi:hypothetical protein
LSAQRKWISYIHNSLITPYKLTYPSVTLITSLVGPSDKTPGFNSAVCSNASASNDIVSAFINGKSVNVSCDGVIWRYDAQSQSLCANCTAICPISYQNPLVFNPSIVAFCGGLNDYKITGYVSVVISRVVASTVPVIHDVAAIPSGTYIDVNVSVISSSDGYLFCAALLGGTELSSVLQIRRSELVTTVTLASSYVYIGIMSLNAFTEYDVFCYTGEFCVS